MRPRVEDYDVDTGVADMLNDYHEAQFAEGRTEEEQNANLTDLSLDMSFRDKSNWSVKLHQP